MPEVLVRVLASTRSRGVCRSCGAALTWAQTVPNGKRIPFDGEPVARRSEHDPSTRALIEEWPADDVHFRTCPQAATWRRT